MALANQGRIQNPPGETYNSLIRSLEVAIEQAYAGLASAFTIPASFSLQIERDRILCLLDDLANMLRDQGDGHLTLRNVADDDSLKDIIADLRRQINQITGNNAKAASQVLSKMNAAQKLTKNKLT